MRNNNNPPRLSPSDSLRILIVAPKSLVGTWQYELQKWMRFFSSKDNTVNVDADKVSINHARGVLPPVVIEALDSSVPAAKRKKMLMEWTNVNESADIGHRATATRCHIRIITYEALVSTLDAISPTASPTSAGASAPAVGHLAPADLRFDLLVLDEGHRLKSLRRRDSRVISEMTGCPRRVILTGTPLQNHLAEYWAMLDIVFPHYFNRKNFIDYFVRPIEKSMNKGAAKAVIEDARGRTYTLQREVQDIILRRDQVILQKELPQLTEYLVFVKLSALQMEVYDRILAVCAAQGKGLSVLRANNYTSKLCAHPELWFQFGDKLREAQTTVIPDSSVSSKTLLDAGEEMCVDDDDEEVKELLLSCLQGSEKEEQIPPSSDGRKRGRPPSPKTVAALPTTNILNDFITVATRPHGYESPLEDGVKLKVAIEIIRNCLANKERILVFSISTTLLDFLSVALSALSVHEEWPALGRFFRIDGQTSTAQRQQQINAFQSQRPSDSGEDTTVYIFMLSIKAGGVGLTLTAANKVIIIDSGWNPADERQAIGRVYRYGQTKNVTVYRLVAHNTIENAICDQKVAKEWLFDTIVDEHSIKRDFLNGQKLQGILCRYASREESAHPSYGEESAYELTPAQREETGRCCANDQLLRALYSIGQLVLVRRAHTLLERDEEFGEKERLHYERFLQEGGLEGPQPLFDSITSRGGPQAPNVSLYSLQEIKKAEEDVVSTGASLRATVNQLRNAMKQKGNSQVAATLAKLGQAMLPPAPTSAYQPQRFVVTQKKTVTGVGASAEVPFELSDSDDDTDQVVQCEYDLTETKPKATAAQPFQYKNDAQRQNVQAAVQAALRQMKTQHSRTGGATKVDQNPAPVPGLSPSAVGACFFPSEKNGCEQK